MGPTINVIRKQEKNLKCTKHKNHKHFMKSLSNRSNKKKQMVKNKLL